MSSRRPRGRRVVALKHVLVLALARVEVEVLAAHRRDLISEDGFEFQSYVMGYMP